MRTARGVALAALLIAASAGLTYGLLAAGVEAGLWLDRRYLETRFVLPKRECPLVMYREYAVPECGWLMPVWGP